MNIAFWDNQLCERGTTVSLFDYAYYNEMILKNKSFIFYEQHNKNNVNTIVNKFKCNFIVTGLNDFNELDNELIKHKITHLYIIKCGLNDNKLSKVAKNCVHCVFTCSEPHGHVYSSISPWIHEYNERYPIVPHMINLPSHQDTMRKELNIPSNAIVFGGYGGSQSFSINFVKQVVFEVAKMKPTIYFLFANFNKFCNDLPNIIHLPMITDADKKVKFINTTDAMLWGREEGETFGISIGEFSSKNKPVIAMNIGFMAHVYLLGNKGIWYKNKQELLNILLNFKPEKKDWNAYRDYTPEKVMERFKQVFLN